MDSGMRCRPRIHSLTRVLAAIGITSALSVGWTPSPVAFETPAQTLGPPSPAVFPLSQPFVDALHVLVGGDGTVYASTDLSGGGRWIVALDSRGHPRPGWPVVVTPGSPPAVAA